jgi:hypothetical protein
MITLAQEKVASLYNEREREEEERISIVCVVATKI